MFTLRSVTLFAALLSVSGTPVPSAGSLVGATSLTSSNLLSCLTSALDPLVGQLKGIQAPNLCLSSVQPIIDGMMGKIQSATSDAQNLVAGVTNNVSGAQNSVTTTVQDAQAWGNYVNQLLNNLNGVKQNVPQASVGDVSTLLSSLSDSVGNLVYTLSKLPVTTSPGTTAPGAPSVPALPGLSSVTGAVPVVAGVSSTVAGLASSVVPSVATTLNFLSCITPILSQNLGTMQSLHANFFIWVVSNGRIGVSR